MAADIMAIDTPPQDTIASAPPPTTATETHHPEARKLVEQAARDA